MLIAKRKFTAPTGIHLFEGKVSKAALKRTRFPESLADKIDRIPNKPIASSHGDQLQCAIFLSEENGWGRLYYLEKARMAGFNTFTWCKNNWNEVVSVSDEGVADDLLIAFLEGLLLSNYEFIKYKKPKDREEQFQLKEVQILSGRLVNQELKKLNALTEAIFIARDLINEPLSYLTALQYSKELGNLSKKFGFKLTVLDEKKIQSLKMGGILAVNRGSVNPPTFNILEWKPAKSRNARPIVLVGKGVVFDTGGLSLKPTKNSMDYMKCDMGGSAIVTGLMCAVASMKLPVHVIGLIPAVENRPGGNAYAPGDVVTMADGTTVEVLNTDAEGRMILADALHYAKRYKPELVCEFSTLTGAAAATLGPHASLIMGTASEETKRTLKECGDQTFERLVELPMWKEYRDMMKSDIADLKNVSGTAGAITAGCFLVHFTDYEYLHFDVAGTAYLDTAMGYRTKGGTGTGIRCVFQFLNKQAN